MGRQLLNLLGADPEQTDSSKLLLDDAALRALYETLVLTRVFERTCAELHQDGELGFYVPALPAAASSAGVAIALQDGDWLFPSFRDTAAYLARGGQLDALLAQMLGVDGDPVRGRQLPGHGGMPDGMFVPPSGIVGANVLHAAGVARAMQLRGDASVAVAVFGHGATEQGSFLTGLGAAVRHDAPAVFVCRTGGAERPSVLQRASGLGLHTELVDGSDGLAMAQTVAAARRRAIDGDGPSLIEAVIEPGAEGDPIGRFRAFVEYRGLWDAEREEDFTARSEQRVLDALEQVRGRGPVEQGAMLEDVWATNPWMLQEQRAKRERGNDE